MVFNVQEMGIYVNTVSQPTAAIIEMMHQLWSSTFDPTKDIPEIAYFIIFQRMPVIEPANALEFGGSNGSLVLSPLRHLDFGTG